MTSGIGRIIQRNSVTPPPCPIPAPLSRSDWENFPWKAVSVIVRTSRMMPLLQAA